jgi:hypothetical protein
MEGPYLARRDHRRAALRPELVLLDLQSKLTLVVPSNTPASDEIQKALLI